MKLRLCIGAGMLVLLGFVALWWLDHFEYIEREVDLGFDRAAYGNNFLAAGRFLRGEGFEVLVEGVSESVSELLASEAILLAQEQQHMGRKEAEALLDWVARGGYLIVGVHKDRGHLAREIGFARENKLSARQCRLPKPAEQDTGDESDSEEDSDIEEDSGDETAVESGSDSPLSERLRQENREYQAQWREQELNRENSKTQNDRAWRQYVRPWFDDYLEAGGENLTPFFFPDTDTTGYVDFDSFFSLIHRPPDPAEEGPALIGSSGIAGQNTRLSFALGAGKVDVLLDTGIWHNDRIGVLDHADVLKGLLLAANVHRVSIVGALKSPSMLEHLRLWAPELIVSLVLLLVAWLLARGYRFGPVYELMIPRRRSLVEHISACGMFLWHGGGRSAMLEALLRPLVAQATLRLGCALTLGQRDDWPRFMDLVNARAPHLASGVAAGRLKRVFYSQSDDIFSEHEFVETVKLLQQLGKVL